jgi:hypothetical protein
MDKAVSAMHQIQLRYARPLNLEARECQATMEHASKVLDRPMKLASDPETTGRAAAAAPSTAAAKSTTEGPPAVAPMADTSPAPLMPAGTLPAGGGLRARLQGRGVTR